MQMLTKLNTIYYKKINANVNNSMGYGNLMGKIIVNIFVDYEDVQLSCGIKAYFLLKAHILPQITKLKLSKV